METPRYNSTFGSASSTLAELEQMLHIEDQEKQAKNLEAEISKLSSTAEKIEAHIEKLSKIKVKISNEDLRKLLEPCYPTQPPSPELRKHTFHGTDTLIAEEPPDEAGYLDDEEKALYQKLNSENLSLETIEKELALLDESVAGSDEPKNNIDPSQENNGDHEVAKSANRTSQSLADSQGTTPQKSPRIRKSARILNKGDKLASPTKVRILSSDSANRSPARPTRRSARF